MVQVLRSKKDAASNNHKSAPVNIEKRNRGIKIQAHYPAYLLQQDKSTFKQRKHRQGRCFCFNKRVINVFNLTGENCSFTLHILRYMFTEQQLKAAHSKVRSGADFPAYIQEIKELGLLRYEYWVHSGEVIYYGHNGYEVRSEAKYSEIIISGNASASALANAISIHQQGQTDFITFCRQVAEAGVEKWVIDTQGMLCIYYDKEGKQMIAEPIPDAGRWQNGRFGLRLILLNCILYF